MNDLIFVESWTARQEKMNGTSHEQALNLLNKAKALVMALWQGTGAATTKQMAEYYDVGNEAIQSCIKDHRSEFESDGLRVVSGGELKALRSQVLDAMSQKDLPEKTTVLTIWTPRAALRLGMLLRDSGVAKAVRTMLLNVVENVRENFHPIVETKLKIQQLKAETEAYKAKTDRLKIEAELIKIETLRDIEFAKLEVAKLKVPKLQKSIRTEIITAEEPLTETIIEFDTLDDFIDRCLRPSEDAADIRQDDLFQAYRQYCIMNGLLPRSISAFVKKLKDLAPNCRIESEVFYNRSAGETQRIPVMWKNIVWAHPNLVKISTQGETKEVTLNTNLCYTGGLAKFKQLVPESTEA
jgi:CBS domain-containing protein